MPRPRLERSVLGLLPARPGVPGRLGGWLTPSSVLAVLIVLLAAFFRLASLSLAEFKGDEAGTATVLKSLVQQGIVPLVGPPLSTGGHAGPAFYYILTVPFLISDNPIVASTFIALLNIAGVALTFKFVREFFSVRVALMTTALEAISPFAVLFSRKIWNPDLVFPFTVILFYCLYSFAVAGKPRYLVPVLVAYAVILQIHPITLFLAPVLLLFLWKSRSRIKPRFLLLGLALSLALFAPFLYGEFGSGFSEAGNFISTLKDFSFSSVNPAVLSLISADTSGTGFDYILGSSAPSFYSSILHVNDLFVLENICLYLGFALVLVRASRSPFGENLRYSILLAWIAIPSLVLLFFNPTFGLYTHHLVMFFPANFLLVALLLDYAMTRRSRDSPLGGRLSSWSKVARYAAVVALISIVLAQVTFGVGLLGFLGSHGGTAGDYGVGVQYKMDVAGYISLDSNGSDFTISSDLTPGQIGSEYYYLLGLYDAVPSSSANLSYVVIDNLSGADPSLMHLLSADPRVDFGPLTVFVVRSSLGIGNPSDPAG
jgi:hypothetical protein